MKLVALLLSLLLLTNVSAVEDENDTGALDPSITEGVNPITITDKTIYGYISDSGQHQILKAVVDALPNVSTTLNEPGVRFTVFAPDDSAFRQLAEILSDGKDALTVEEYVQQIVKGVTSIKRGPGFTDVRGILFYHVIGKHYTFAELEEFGTIATAQGKNLTFADGQVEDLDPSRPNATASQQNIFTQNGWVHAVNSVLLPFNLNRAIRVSRPTSTPTPQPGATTTDPDPVETTPDETTTGTDPDPVSTSPESEDVELSPTPADPTVEDDPVCFPSTARVHTPAGTVTMDKLEAGQEVMHHESGKASKVFLFTHRTDAHEGWFYRITTALGHAVTMTGNHYLYANDRLTAADAVVLGDALRTVSGISPVVKVERVKGTGLYAPHSIHGDLVVDGIVVSGYSRAVRPGVAHAVLAPVRWLVKISGIREPFGALLYEGGRGMDQLLPKGKARY